MGDGRKGVLLRLPTIAPACVGPRIDLLGSSDLGWDGARGWLTWTTIAFPTCSSRPGVSIPVSNKRVGEALVVQVDVPPSMPIRGPTRAAVQWWGGRRSNTPLRPSPIQLAICCANLQGKPVDIVEASLGCSHPQPEQRGGALCTCRPRESRVHSPSPRRQLRPATRIIFRQKISRRITRNPGARYSPATGELQLRQ